MRGLYSSPLRVYICLAALAIAGLICGSKLPVSLFPNSSKPEIEITFPYGNSSAEEFLNAYGSEFERELKQISTGKVEVEKVTASYYTDNVNYEVEFKWGSPFQEALREVLSVKDSFGARLPTEVREGSHYGWDDSNTGFLVISFYSPKRSLDELYDLLDPVLTPQLARVPDAQDPGLWNPERKEVRIELDPGKMASLQIMPRDVDAAVFDAINGHNGGAVDSGDTKLSVLMPRLAWGLDDFGRVPVASPSGHSVHLGDLARIDYATRITDERSFKTSGAPSLILFAMPKAGGNIKQMSDDMLEIVRNAMPSLPKDIQYRVLVDPSEFINSAIHNVMREVLMGGLLAVAVLFLFIGSLRNTITAAIEIPLSMVLAFILMRLSGMNLNLISLGGLALSAGMNVDASVVVMENIFRHFEEVEGPLTYPERLSIIVQSVREVRLAVIASTLSSIVVFLPLAFTSDLSYAILGDLAKTVVFSHGFSAFVALILVPTVRLQLMSRGGGAAVTHSHSPIEPWIRKLENGYAAALKAFLRRGLLRKLTYAGLATALALLLALVLPRLPREVIGRPDTDWITINVNTSGNTVFRQMESQAEDVEARIIQLFGKQIRYTFTQVQNPQNGFIMARLKDKGEMRALWKEMEARLTNTPKMRFWIEPWNPAELPIPDPPQLKILVQGSSIRRRTEATRQISDLLDENHVLPNIHTAPNVDRTDQVVLRPNADQWTTLHGQFASVLPSDVADLARVATVGRKVGRLAVHNQVTDVYLRFPDNYTGSVEALGALPVGLGSRIVPLRALFGVSVEEQPPSFYRENGRDLFVVYGERNKSAAEEKTDHGYQREAEELVAKWRATHSSPPPVSAGGKLLAVASGAGAAGLPGEASSARVRKASQETPFAGLPGATAALADASAGDPVVSFDDPEKDLNEALHQLTVAVILSILLIFLTLLIQFGDAVSSLLVLVAVPLGMIGVLASLFVFRSTLSLNSVLGVILLNGIAVANSIILVDFQRRLVERGLSPLEAALEAGRKRLRPILITSLTTILAMLPVAAGLGEGGRILQPLGIAVSGGLWVSMGFTLFVVPALQVNYMNWQARRREASA